jgi:hypothetical protein
MNARKDLFQKHRTMLIQKLRGEIEIIEEMSYEDFEKSINPNDDEWTSIYHAVRNFSIAEETNSDYLSQKIKEYFDDKLSEPRIG